MIAFIDEEAGRRRKRPSKKDVENYKKNDCFPLDESPPKIVKSKKPKA